MDNRDRYYFSREGEMPNYTKLGGPYWAAAFLTKSLASLRRLKKWRINPHFRSAPCSREPLVLAQ